MKFEIRNKLTGDVQFTADIEAEENAPISVKIGLSVKWALSNNATLSGAYLNGAYLRDANLRDANLRDANLSGANLSGATLSGANLRDANLSGANLSGANLSGANLSGANLNGANLSDAYLRGAPFRIENIHTRIYEAASKEGALEMSNWHTCETTHCRAGWAVILAGDAGRTLEWAYGTPAAAYLIYIVSDPNLDKLPDFYCDNETALADMKRLAEEEAKKAA